MNRKLPSAARYTLDDLRSAVGSALAAEQGAPPTTATPVERELAAEPAPETPRPAKPAAKVVAAQTEKPVARTAPRLTKRSGPPPRADFIEASGHLIIERHANIAAVAGLVPLPWIDLAAVAIVVDRMLRKLAKLYGKPLEADRSRRLATAMLAAVAVPGIASFATTGLLRMTPGPNFLGMALTSLSAAVLVRVIGDVYLDHLRTDGGEVVAAG